MKSRRRKAIRRRLINSGQQNCFYCGLPFNDFLLPKGTTGAAKARRFATVTLEHLQPLSLEGQTTTENCVLAHGWCNATASNLPFAEKMELKKRLSNNDGTPPWWPVIEKLIAKKKV